MDYFRIVNLVGVQIALTILRSAGKAEIAYTIPFIPFGYAPVQSTKYPFIVDTVEITETEEGTLDTLIDYHASAPVVSDIVQQTLADLHNEGSLVKTGPNTISHEGYELSFTVH